MRKSRPTCAVSVTYPVMGASRDSRAYGGTITRSYPEGIWCIMATTIEIVKAELRVLGRNVWQVPTEPDFPFTVILVRNDGRNALKRYGPADETKKGARGEVLAQAQLSRYEGVPITIKAVDGRVQHAKINVSLVKPDRMGMPSTDEDQSGQLGELD